MLRDYSSKKPVK